MAAAALGAAGQSWSLQPLRNASEFLEEARDFLAATEFEVENSLHFGLAHRLLSEGAHVYGKHDPWFWIIRTSSDAPSTQQHHDQHQDQQDQSHQEPADQLQHQTQGAVVGTVLLTPPYPLSVSPTCPPAAASLLVQALRELLAPEPELTDMISGTPEFINAFIAEWRHQHGGKDDEEVDAHPHHSRLRMMCLSEPPAPPPAEKEIPGKYMLATPEHEVATQAMLDAFHLEATPELSPPPSTLAQLRISQGCIHLWCCPDEDTEQPTRRVVARVKDPLCPLGGTVYEDYDVLLHQVGFGGNNVKFYVIQIIDTGSDYRVWTHWGRFGEQGQHTVLGPFDLDRAKRAFRKKFYDKTRNEWENRHTFVIHPGKYLMVGLAPEEEPTVPAERGGGGGGGGGGTAAENVATTNATPVSMVMHTRPTESTVSLSWVYTLPESRGRCFSRALLTHVCNMLRETYRHILLFVDTDNPASSKLYQNLGFKPSFEWHNKKFR